jgi:hypothetical protein
MWFCEYLSAPAGKRMAFCWSFFFVLLGVLALGQGLGLFNLSGVHRGRIVFDAVNAEPTLCRP